MLNFSLTQSNSKSLFYVLHVTKIVTREDTNSSLMLHHSYDCQELIFLFQPETILKRYTSKISKNPPEVIVYYDPMHGVLFVFNKIKI